MVFDGLTVGAGLPRFYMNLRRNQAKKGRASLTAGRTTGAEDTAEERPIAHDGSVTYTDVDAPHLPASRVESRD